MRRSGFTMVELIFVIVIIGILAAVALPKFAGVKDNAKANSELSAMNSLEGAIIGTVEFRYQDYSDRLVDWHDTDIDDATNKATGYKQVNKDNNILKTIMKKGDKFSIIGYAEVSTDTNASNDILLITGEASNRTNGIKEPTDGDILGKPDKNDFWVFNPNNFDLNVSSSTATDLVGGYSIVTAESIGLVDVNESVATSNITIDSMENNDTSNVTDVSY